jgi:hypothetical protein
MSTYIRLFTISFFALLCISNPITGNGQEKEDDNDLLKLLDQQTTPKKEYTTATFKSTRIANGHSIENVAKGVLDIRIFLALIMQLPALVLIMVLTLGL